MAKPFVAEQIVADFGRRSPLAQTLVGTLAEAARAHDGVGYRRWQRLFGSLYGHQPADQRASLRELVKRYARDNESIEPGPLEPGPIEPGPLEPGKVLFALQTYYAVLVKLLGAQVAAGRRTQLSPAVLLRSASTAEERQRVIWRLENGELLAACGVAGHVEPDVFSWYADIWSPALDDAIGRLATTWADYEIVPEADGIPSQNGDLSQIDRLKVLYHDVLPRAVRHELGEYYTPDWLADHVLDQVAYQGELDGRLIDPACGSGTFLMLAIRRATKWFTSNSGSNRKAGDPSRQTIERFCRQVSDAIVGVDLNPLAVVAARTNYLVALADLLPEVEHLTIPVRCGDTILDCRALGASDSHSDADTEAAVGSKGFDWVVGNPPWIAWDHLPEAYREATKPLWQKYGLFSLSGTAGRHGGGKKDLSALMTYAVADRLLNDKGKLGFVVTQTLFQTKGAGHGFRRFQIGEDGPRLKVVRVDDLADLRPFGEAANWTATVVLQKGRATHYPVPYVKWTSGNGDGHGKQRPLVAEPIDAADPCSAWLVHPAAASSDVRQLVGPSDYQAFLGANTGGANGVYWLEVIERTERGVRVRNLAGKGKRTVESVETIVEPDLLYPLLRWGNVQRWRATPSAWLLLAQDPVTRSGIEETRMKIRCPLSYAYLRQFAELLRSRAAYRRYQGEQAFYSMYNVGTYTLAPLKVVWRRMDRQINAVVVPSLEDPVIGLRPVVPQETCVVLPASSLEEAHYVCAVLNSRVVHELVAACSVRGGKGFGTPGMLEFVRLLRFVPEDRLHRRLGTLSQKAHDQAAIGAVDDDLVHEIDERAMEL